MKKYFSVCSLFCLMLFLNMCKNQESVSVSSQDDFPKPPVAKVVAKTFTEFGNQRVDNYFWMREKTNPDVIQYLKDENKYCDTVMANTKKFQETLFAEMKGRIKEDDVTVPQLSNGYYYYSKTEKDKQYQIYCRKNGSLDAQEEVIFDVNKMAEGFNAFLFGGYDVSDNNQLVAYIFNTTGSFVSYTVKVRDLKTGNDLPDILENVQSMSWAADNKTIFYTIGNDALRSYRVYRHELGSKNQDVLLFEEKDDLFNVNVGRSKTKEFNFIVSESFTSSEFRMLASNNPTGEFKVFAPRKKDVIYYVSDHKDKFYILYKDNNNKNKKLMEAPKTGYENISTWKDVIAHNPDAMIDDFDVFEKFIALSYTINGLTEIHVLNLANGNIKKVNFPEPVYTCSTTNNPEYSATKLRYNYSSLNRPWTDFDYDMENDKSIKLKEQEIPSGFNADNYTVERLWATASDGTKVPVSVVYKKDLKKDGSNPTLLYSYGSYGYSTEPYFSSRVFSLIDRGFVYALAHIRGGSDLGELWYENGKLLKKKNTFTDFISCAEYLVKEKYTSPDKLAIMGGSAGGLLVGAVANMRPDLFKVVLAIVPFVDVINTMLDETLPLTTQEYEQWGNPKDEEYYKYIMSYSPYDNVKAQAYPNILATAGLNDSQVSFHEPAKWIAKIRALKTDKNIVLLKTNMESGHGGATGRFDYLKEVAFEYSFILDRFGMINE